MDVSWFTCRPNDRQKMPSLLPGTTNQIAQPPFPRLPPLSGHDADSKIDANELFQTSRVQAYYQLRVLLTRNG